jgi:hypothetical protein
MDIKRTESEHKRISSRKRRGISFKTHLQHVEDLAVRAPKRLDTGQEDAINLKEIIKVER